MILYFYVILIYKFTQTQNISKSLQTSPRHEWAIDVQRHSHLLHRFLRWNRRIGLSGSVDSWDQTSKIQHISMTGLPWFEMILTWFWRNQDPCVDFDENNGHVIVFEFMFKLTCWPLIFAENIHYFDETMMLDTIQFGLLL